MNRGSTKRTSLQPQRTARATSSQSASSQSASSQSASSRTTSSRTTSSRTTSSRTTTTLRARQRAVACDAILEAAEIELGKSGMTARMDSIARRAGVSVGTLYNHFADRDALLSALFSARRKQVLARVHDVIERTASLPFRQRLHAALSAMLVVDPVAARFRRLLLEEGPAPNRVEQRKKASELLAVFAPVLAHGRREGALGDDGGDVQPVFLLALTQTALWLSATSPERLSPDDAAGVVVAQFLDGASAPRRGGRR